MNYFIYTMLNMDHIRHQRFDHFRRCNGRTELWTQWWFDLLLRVRTYRKRQACIYCLSRFLVNNIDWLEEEIGDYEDDYLIFDCPGQIELYTHFPIMKRLCEALSRLNMSICGVYCLESQFIEDKSKYFSGVLSAMSAMVNLEIPHINVMTKMDLIEGDYGNKRASEEEEEQNEDDEESAATQKRRRQRRRRRLLEKAMTERELDRYLEPDPLLIAEEAEVVYEGEEQPTARSLKFQALTQAIVQLVQENARFLKGV